jgi:hypothetical protein
METEFEVEEHDDKQEMARGFALSLAQMLHDCESEDGEEREEYYEEESNTEEMFR